MIYFTGDTHGDTLKIIRFAERMHLRKEDTIIILGNAGYNYYGNERDRIAKQRLSHLKPTILCIHGNHEIRLPIYPPIKQRSGTAASCGMRRNTPTYCSPRTARSTR